MKANTQTEHTALDHVEQDYLSLIRSERWGLYASAGENYRGGVFGRDSIEAAEEILDFNQELAKVVIFSMAKLQGRHFNNTSEEEPGRIHHEYRELTDHTSANDRRIFTALSANWGKEAITTADGENIEIMAYYGSVDATPLFVRLVGKYCDKYGADILNEAILNERDGRVCTLKESLQFAVEWIEQRITASSWGLLEFHKQNPKGISNQVWKDSDSSYIHEDGTYANSQNGIAAIEVQGYAYDALLSGAQHLDQGNQAYYLELAKGLQTRVLNSLWVNNTDKDRLPFFAMGLDRDDNGQTRQIKTRSSNAGLLLDSRLLLDLPPVKRAQYVDPVVKTLMSDEFLTPVGIRCRGTDYAQIIDYADYHGTYAVWPKETSDVAHGLYNHRYTKEGLELSQRIVKAIENTNMQFYEFFFVDLENRIRTPGELNLNSSDKFFRWDQRMNLAETFQAWTISAYEFHKRKLIRHGA